MMKTAKIIASVLIFLIFLNVASALTINSVDADTLAPGQEGKISITLTYTINDAIKQKTGTIGITLRANPEIIYSISQEKPIMGQSDKITLKLINKGFADAKFALIKVFPDGYTLTSDNEIYIGSVDSDDFQTASFDVTYTEKNPVFSATIEYKDFDNKKKLETISLPLTIYTQEEAIKLGLIS